MRKIIYTISFALLCSFGCSAFAAAPTGMTQQDFNQQISQIEKNYPNRKDKLAKYEEFLKANKSNMNNVVKGQLANKMLSVAVSARSDEYLKKAIALAKEANIADVNVNFIRNLLGLRNKDAYAQDVLDFEKLILSMDPKAPGQSTAVANLIKVYAGANRETYAKAEGLFKKGNFNTTQKFDICLNFVKSSFSVIGDMKVVESWFDQLLNIQKDAVKAVKADEAECAKAKKRANPNLAREASSNSNKIMGLVNDFLKIDYAATMRMFNKAKPYLSEDQIATFELGTLGIYALAKSDDKTYQKIRAKVVKMPYSPLRTRIVGMIAAKTTEKDRGELYELEMKNPDITPEKKFNIFGGLRSPYKEKVAWFQRGFNNPDAYPMWKIYTDKMLEQNALCDKRKPADASFYNDAAYTAFGYGDFKFAEQMIAEAQKLAPKDAKVFDTAVMIYLHKKDTAKVSALIADRLSFETNPSSKIHWRTVDFFNKGGKPADFDKAFAADNLSSVDKMNYLRNASEILFRAKRFDICQAIYDDILNNRFVSLKPLEYKAVYLKNPPRTADGFVRTPYYNDWRKMETRFRPYGDCPAVSAGTDAKWFLKDVEKETIAKGWETGIFCAFNEEGFHIYVRCNDPEVIDVIQGKRDGGTLECTFRPGPDAPYNMWFFSGLPNSKDEIDIDFASPSPVYKLTRDVFKVDAATTEEGLVAHTFIPWLPYHYSLPLDGKCWYIGLQRWCKGGGQTISGQVHELARMLNVKFDLTKEQQLAIKKFVCRAAYNKFMTGKANLDVWANDVELGDPKFYSEVLEPLVKELEDAGKQLDDPKADINAIFDKYVSLWAEFDYVVAEKRKNWLKTQFFK